MRGEALHLSVLPRRRSGSCGQRLCRFSGKNITARCVKINLRVLTQVVARQPLDSQKHSLEYIGRSKYISTVDETME